MICKLYELQTVTWCRIRDYTPLFLCCRCIYVTTVSGFSVWTVIYLYTRHYIPVQDVPAHVRLNSPPKWQAFLDKGEKLKMNFIKKRLHWVVVFKLHIYFAFFTTNITGIFFKDITFSKKKESKRNKLRISENCGRSACPCIPVKIQNTITIRSVLHLCTRYCNWWEWWVPF